MSFQIQIYVHNQIERSIVAVIRIVIGSNGIIYILYSTKGARHDHIHIVYRLKCERLSNL